MDPNVLSHIAEIVSASLCVALGSSAAAYAQGKVISQTTDAMARQPELANDLRFTMIIGLAMIESLAIYCLLISLILLFVKW
ncbi:MAG TPA: ATP synthase F0 subunit C [Candidatus Rifleibacterium sp.]|nr:ATP synthase F0 subunit C [Candidatus Rifleibacterium sp.]HPT45996.1 ATP synthase F0 subunit C [Candidatus Rifleibacterium sp.]